jgi:hypothetical protein
MQQRNRSGLIVALSDGETYSEIRLTNVATVHNYTLTKAPEMLHCATVTNWSTRVWSWLEITGQDMVKLFLLSQTSHIRGVVTASFIHSFVHSFNNSFATSAPKYAGSQCPNQFTLGQETEYQLNKRRRGPQSRSGRFQRTENLLSHQGLDQQTSLPRLSRNICRLQKKKKKKVLGIWLDYSSGIRR